MPALGVGAPFPSPDEGRSGHSAAPLAITPSTLTSAQARADSGRAARLAGCALETEEESALPSRQDDESTISKRGAAVLVRWQHAAHALHPVPPTCAVLSAISSTRFAHGLFCPRCHATAVQRWGWFGSRKRYRCRVCRRTFSSLTGTAAAYTKKLHLWPAYVGCLSASLPIRRCAVLVGIAPSTAFRWRHRILASLNAGDAATALSGVVEIDEAGFAYSEKGRRNGTRPGRKRGVWGDLRTRCKHPRVSVAVACDRSGSVVSAVVRADHIRIHDLTATILPRIVQPATLLITEGSMGSCAAAIRRTLPCYAVPRFSRDASRPQLYHTDSVRSFIGRFNGWLLPFRGVATRYLHHYLAWHRSIDEMADRVTGTVFLRRLDGHANPAVRK
jgi:transposase-like protein